MSVVIRYIKVQLLIFLCVFLFTACFKNNAANKNVAKVSNASSVITSFFPGEEWNDTNGNPIHANAGGVLYHEGIYYWYGECNADSITDEGLKGISCYSSKDLMNWNYEGIVLDNHEEQIHGSPKVIYNAKTNNFVMWIRVTGTDNTKAKTGVAVSSTPTGKFHYAGSLTPDNSVNAAHTLFVDDDGSAYYFKVSDNILHISRLTDDYLTLKNNVSRQVNSFCDITAIFKYNNKYYLLLSGATPASPGRAEVAVADSVYGTWKIIGNLCSGPDAENTFNAINTSVISVHGKENAFIAMFDKLRTVNTQKSTHVWLPIVFENDVPAVPWYDYWDMTVFLK